jgi:hypothetical protein
LSRIAWSLVSVRRSTLNFEPAANVPSGLTMIAPVIASVVPTASFGKLMPASCSFTRYRAFVPCVISSLCGLVGSGGGPPRPPGAGACVAGVCADGWPWADVP